MYSDLCTNTFPAIDAKSDSRGSTRVSHIIIHHMAGVQGGLACAKMHYNGNYQASANYYIGVEGDICGGVDEARRAWTTGGSIDYSGITFEVSNNKTGEPWSISDASYMSMINLCADICIRYNLTPYFDGTKGGTLLYHQMFGATACPGTTLIGAIKSGQVQNDIARAMQDMHRIPENTDMLYRVQVGAFAVKSNAENYLKTLQSQGYKDAFIVEGKR